jgi:hypothetical protein
MRLRRSFALPGIREGMRLRSASGGFGLPQCAGGEAGGGGAGLLCSRRGKQPVGADLDDRLHLRPDGSARHSHYNRKAKFESDSRI